MVDRPHTNIHQHAYNICSHTHTARRFSPFAVFPSKQNAADAFHVAHLVRAATQGLHVVGWACVKTEWIGGVCVCVCVCVCVTHSFTSGMAAPWSTTFVPAKPRNRPVLCVCVCVRVCVCVCVECIYECGPLSVLIMRKNG